MTKGQFAMLTAALGLATMGGAGYIACASTSPGHTTKDSGSSVNVQSGGSSSSTVNLPADGSSAQSTDSDVNGVAACVNGEVQVTEQTGQGAAGHISLLLIFQNTGSTACSLHGYPGASLTSQSGADLLDASRTLSGYLGGAVGLAKAPTVVLAPGGRASAVLEWSDVQNGSAPGGCEVQNAANLVVTPPNFTQSTTLAAAVQVCSGFDIHPVLKGLVSEPGVG